MRVQKLGFSFGSIIVSKNSATLGLANHRETQISIEANHSEICKFAGQDELFAPVSYHINRLAKGAVAFHDSMGEMNRSGALVHHDEHKSTISEEGSNHIPENGFVGLDQIYFNEKKCSCLSSLAATDQKILVKRLSKIKNPSRYWFFGSLDFKNWNEKQSTDLIFVTGGPGFGKTTLAVSVIENIIDSTKHFDEHQSIAATDDKPFLLYFLFGDTNVESRGTAAAAIRTIVSQLIHQCPSLFPILFRRYVLLSTRGSISWSWDLLWMVFLEMLAKIENHPVIYLILDGFDECERDSKMVFIAHLNQIIEENKSETLDSYNYTLKILITSRIDEQVSQVLSKHKKVEIKSSDTAEDMQNFIQSEVLQISETRCLPSNIRDSIIVFLQSNSHGMFLWVSLVIDELKRRDERLTDDALNAKLLKVPPTLFSTYETILADIPSPRRKDLWRILRWLVFGKQAMKLIQLEAALCLESNIKSWHDFPGDVRFLCGPLIRIVDDEVFLVHQTAGAFIQQVGSYAYRDDLEGISMDSISADTHITGICIDFMMESDIFNKTFLTKSPRYEIRLDPFLEYAVTHWAHHLRSIQRVDATLSTKIIEFFKPLWRRDIIMCLTYHVHQSYEIRGFGFPASSSALHLASYFKLVWLVERYLADGVNPNILGNSGDTPLVWASETGSEQIVEKLLDAGSDPNIVECDGWSALHWAATNGHTRVAELLLAHGARSDAKDSEGLVPADWAARRDNWAVVAAIHRQKSRDAEKI